LHEGSEVVTIVKESVVHW